MHRLLLVTTASLLLIVSSTACRSTSGDWTPDLPESEFVDRHMLGEIAKLAGQWDNVDEEGTVSNGSHFVVSSNGSIVREIMFPGDPHEMTNVYHMDGNRLVLTHYCAVGNQPRMKAAYPPRDVEGGTAFAFAFDSVTNYREEHEGYMGAMTLTILANGEIRQDWDHFDAEGTKTSTMSFTLRRRP